MRPTSTALTLRDQCSRQLVHHRIQPPRERRARRNNSAATFELRQLLQIPKRQFDIGGEVIADRFEPTELCLRIYVLLASGLETRDPASRPGCIGSPTCGGSGCERAKAPTSIQQDMIVTGFTGSFVANFVLARYAGTRRSCSLAASGQMRAR